jgi:hypothetical protein
LKNAELMTLQDSVTAINKAKEGQRQQSFTGQYHRRSWFFALGRLRYNHDRTTSTDNNLDEEPSVADNHLDEEPSVATELAHKRSILLPLFKTTTTTTMARTTKIQIND